MSHFRILIVDDEEAMRESLAAWLLKGGHRVDTAASGPEALERMAVDDYDLVMADVKMPGMDGLELLSRIKAEYPFTLVVVITAYGSIESAVTAMKMGASDYLLKPFDPEQLVLLVEKMVSQRGLIKENIALKARILESQTRGFEDLVGASEPMRRVFALIEDVAPTEAPVLITGETGTGKELVSRAIHARSNRAFGPFVAINCGAMTETLLESELFGHERGAFTGAVKARRGRLEMADKGTLFLDEVGEISPQMQVDLLRVLEEKSFNRIGGNELVSSDFRLICATHRDLAAMVEEGQFRSDFYYRINVISVRLPPLRERLEDIPLLASYLLDGQAREAGRRIEGFTPEALEVLTAYAWPGNVRELKNVVERAVIIARGQMIGLEDLAFLRPAAAEGPRLLSLKEMEIDHIQRVLEACEWNVTRAGKLLGIDRVTLSRKIKRYGLVRPGRS